MYTVSDSFKLTCFVWNGKENEIGSDCYPVMISNNAKYLYFMRAGSLYVQTGLKDDKREKLGDGVSGSYANRDLSQLVFETGTKCYISRDGGAAELLSDRAQAPLFLQGVAGLWVNKIISFDILSFSNTFYQSAEQAIVRINGEYKASSIVKGISYANLADDGKTLTYLRNSRIYKVNGSDDRLETVQVVDENAILFSAAADGGALYYLNGEYNLFYQKGTGKPVAVASGLSDGINGEYTLFKNTFFYIYDSKLYSAKGGKASPVPGIGGDVTSILSSAFEIIVTAEDAGKTLMYYSSNGKTFERLND
jgi:hypothetical protein